MTARLQPANPPAIWQRRRTAVLAMIRNAATGSVRDTIIRVCRSSAIRQRRPACPVMTESAATGQSLTHVPLPTAGQDCLVCHDTGFTSFALPTFDHAAAGITNNCASCHDGKAHDGVIVIKKPAGHIPTSADCSTCHADTTNGPGVNGTVTSGFTNADPFVNTVHPAYTTGCRTCHNASYDNAIYLAQGPSERFRACHGRFQRLGMQRVSLDDRQFPGNQSGQPPGSGRQERNRA